MINAKFTPKTPTWMKGEAGGLGDNLFGDLYLHKSTDTDLHNPTHTHHHVYPTLLPKKAPRGNIRKA